jgi:hypothetical protein
MQNNKQNYSSIYLDLAESKVVPVHDTKAYRWNRGTAPLILNLGSKCRRVVSFTPRPLYLQKIAPVPIE